MLLNYSPALDPGPAPGSQEWALWRGGKDAVRIPQNQTAVKVQEDKRSRSTRVGLWKMREMGTGGAGRRRKQSDIPAPGRERERGRSDKATVSRNIAHCLQPPHCRAGEPLVPGAQQECSRGCVFTPASVSEPSALQGINRESSDSP